MATSKTKTVKKIKKAAGFAFAITFTLNGCSGDGGGGDAKCGGMSYDPEVYRCESGEIIGKCQGVDYYVASQLCVNGVVADNTFTDSRDNKIYSLVNIGEQIWMAENLNYNASGMCYDNDPANCTKYGKLYDWATAMSLPSSCNSYTANCSGQINAKHQGICPFGWHIPSEEDWETLISYVENDNGCTNCAGKYLRATSGWHRYYEPIECGTVSNNGYVNGKDTYGFSALPGGLYGLNGLRFDEGGYSSLWWSSHEGGGGMSIGCACSCERAYFGNYGLYELYISVRCVKD
jgi:uncharacterized protein (TIGR02145 family)